MSTVPILLFRLEGPMQSWGEHSKWDYRDTADFPSKSGVVGLIACAMGLERGNHKIGELCKELSMTVRADRKGIQENDFHTVIGNPLAKANGEKRANGNTVISNRVYLHDASFLVGLSGSYDILEECKEALNDPRWQIYLGRKSCVPSVPIVPVITEEYETIKDAMEKLPLCERHDSVITIQEESMENDGYYRTDIIGGGLRRNFYRRRVKNEQIMEE